MIRTIIRDGGKVIMMSIELKGKVRGNAACIKSSMEYRRAKREQRMQNNSEVWKSTNSYMVRWICGESLRKRKTNEFRSTLEKEPEFYSMLC